MSKHREIYKAHYGQDSIKDGNVIHHLDHDPTNNSIINLAQMSRLDHSRLHNTGSYYSHIKPIAMVEKGISVNDEIIWFDI